MAAIEMAYDEKLAARVRKLLAGRADVVEKRMFGGLCFMVNGAMCCGLTQTEFLVRVGPAQFEAALERPHTRPMDFTGRPSKGTVYVAAAALRTDKALGEWVGRGLQFVLESAPGTRERARSKRGKTET